MIENIIKEWLPWVWLLLAMIFSIAELFTAGFFLVCFAIGAGVAALLGFLGLATVWQLLAFVVVSGLLVLYAQQIADRISNPNSHPVGIDRIIGQEGIVLETIDPNQAHGKVRVSHEEWSADSIDDVLIPAGVRVAVVAVEGTHLKVRTANIIDTPASEDAVAHKSR